ncbi:MAG: helix-turn-helix domain-containing protein [Deltaproteobacteria bacterium]|nr:helix-turn-helix domain-containing protein [Deltaproteobacteria bacterium]MBW2044085.1 helix-turn-helix domain-containing protein [Deltaproteobacteria bacterium]MBW2301473.1 helix-turn-helix domain-containing protein [Deltaproteobacteria bacterium]
MELGEKIRAERNRAKMTLDQLAKKVGISKMTLQRIETGKTSPSIAVLGDIAQALQKPLSSFIEEKSGFIKITRKKDQFSFENDKLKARNILPRGSIGLGNVGGIAINYVEAKNGVEVETHINKGFEWVFQISGKAILLYDGKEYVSTPGDVFFYDGRRPHSVKYKGKNRFLLISFK